ncbi:MAG: hypothetical protein HQK51_14675 [Oligoflexia bacterium]|nr:hypothetical protein [Oligoflexia bacterium]
MYMKYSKSIVIVMMLLFSLVCHADILEMPDGWTKERVDNEMKNRGFPNSDYPYYERYNGCGKSTHDIVPETYLGVVDFGHYACVAHDRCYMTLAPGRSRADCDKDMFGNMKNDCKRDLGRLSLQLHGLCDKLII